MYREHHPVEETVRKRTVVAAYAQPGLDEVVLLIPGRPCRAAQFVTGLRSPSEPVFFYGGVVKLTPVVEILICNRLTHRGVQRLLKELGREFGNYVETVLMLFSVKILGGLLLFGHLDVILPAEIADGLGKGHALVLHHEIHRRPCLAAAEAFVDALGRGDVERRGLFVVEGAAGGPVRPATLQVDEIADHVHNLCDIQNTLYRVTWNHHHPSLIITLSFQTRGTGDVESVSGAATANQFATSQRNLSRTRRISFSSQSSPSSATASSTESDSASSRKYP